jgi:dihydrofolate reductase
LFLNPILVGGGKRALPDKVRAQLQLVDERRFTAGVAHLHYPSASEPASRGRRERTILQSWLGGRTLFAMRSARFELPIGVEMSRLRLSITMSLDGYVGGPNQSEENPLGVGGMELHEWFFPLEAFREMHGEQGGDVNASSAVVEERRSNIGATIMGRNMFGPVRGPWPDESWRGWWGEDPPYHHPVFVLTHHPREPLEMEGGTTFHFVSDGIESALTQAKDAARGRDVWLAGGASVVNQYLAAQLVDEIDVSIAPLILGAGVRLFEGLDRGKINLTQLRAVDAPGVTHIKYAVS